MLRRTFIGLMGLMGITKPVVREPQKVNGVWEAPGFDCMFLCQNCGLRMGGNIVSTCCRCGKSHWSVESVHVTDDLSFYFRSIKENCIMARNVTIFVPSEKKAYRAHPETGRPVAYPAQLSIDMAINARAVT